MFFISHLFSNTVTSIKNNLLFFVFLKCKLPSGLCEIPIREDIEASFIAERLKAAEMSAKTGISI